MPTTAPTSASNSPRATAARRRRRIGDRLAGLCRFGRGGQVGVARRGSFGNDQKSQCGRRPQADPRIGFHVVLPVDHAAGAGGHVFQVLVDFATNPLHPRLHGVVQRWIIHDRYHYGLINRMTRRWALPPTAAGSAWIAASASSLAAIACKTIVRHRRCSLGRSRWRSRHSPPLFGPVRQASASRGFQSIGRSCPSLRSSSP